MSSSGPNSPPAPRASRRQIPGWLFAACVIAAVVMVAWTAFREFALVRESDRCRDSLRRIAIALHAYHDVHRSFPPAYVVGKNGERLHSWRVLLLPYLGQQKLYDEYRFDEPWNGPHNRELIAKIPALYACPSTGGQAAGVTQFLAVVGRATAWPEHYGARLEDFSDGASQTIQVVESGDSDVLWLEPRDITHRQALKRDLPVNYPTISSAREKGDKVLVLLADGAIRALHRDFLTKEAFPPFLTAGGGRWMARGDWPPETDPAAELPPSRPATDFRGTDVVPCPTAEIIPGRNAVYCATFELAWDDAQQRLGTGRLELLGAPALVGELAGHTFDRRNLSEASYVARGGIGDGTIQDLIRDEMARKFPGSVPRLLDRDPDPHVVVIYAYLLKSLPFGAEFDSLVAPLRFRKADGEAAVASFGVAHLDDTGSRGKALQVQVTIHDYVSDDDFVLGLKPAVQDEIVLAKVAPARTLEATVESVRERIAKPRGAHLEQRLFRNESLIIPKLVASVEREYSELVPRPVIGTDLYVSLATQVIRFRLDETGALLESEAALAFDDGHPVTPAGKRQFVFDRPFLIFLIEQRADQPYFAAWIENSELMLPAPK